MIIVIFFFFSFFLLYKYNKSIWLSIIVQWGVLIPFLRCYIYNPIVSYILVRYVFYLDSLNVVLLVLTVWITCIIFLCRQFVLINNINVKSFIFFVLFLIFVLLLTFRIMNLFYFYILFEVRLLPTLVIILGWGYQPERIQAGIYLIIYTICASLPLFLCLLYLYNICGSSCILFLLDLGDLNGILGVWWVLCIMAFMVKIPMYLTHLWLPKAHVEAPVAGSMILAGVLLKLGGYGLIRFRSLLIICNNYVSGVFLSVSIWGACITRLICLRQVDLKSLIAYSSVGHIGLVIGGVISNQSWGWYGALAIIVAHGLVSSGLFALGNITYEVFQTRSLYMIKGLLSVLPRLSFFWFVFCIINIAAPPSINLLGEILLLSSILRCRISISLLLGVRRFLSARYSLYLYTCINHGQFRFRANVIYPNSLRNIDALLFHCIPVVFLIFCPSLILLFI